MGNGHWAVLDCGFWKGEMEIEWSYTLVGVGGNGHFNCIRLWFGMGEVDIKGYYTVQKGERDIKKNKKNNSGVFTKCDFKQTEQSDNKLKLNTNGWMCTLNSTHTLIWC